MSSGLRHDRSSDCWKDALWRDVQPDAKNRAMRLSTRLCLIQLSSTRYCGTTFCFCLLHSCRCVP